MKKLFIIALLCFCSFTLFAQDSLMTHYVKTGETISSICKYYGITKKEFNKLNPSVKNYVYTGQVLNIPVLATSQSTTEISSSSDISEDNIEQNAQLEETEGEKVIAPAPSQKPDSEKMNYGDDSKSQKEIFNYDDRFQMSANYGLGLYLKPKGLESHFFGFSWEPLDIGVRINLSEVLFVEGTCSMGIDYSISWDKKSSGSGDFKVTTKARNSDYKGTVGIPIRLGVNVGPVSLRGGVWGRVAYVGCQTTYSKIDSEYLKEENSTFKTYSEIKDDNKNFDRVTYGLSFDVTAKSNDGRYHGLGFKVVTSKHSKQSMKLISYVIHY